MTQLHLFDPAALPAGHRALLSHYASARNLSVSQDQLYTAEASRKGISIDELKSRKPIGKDGACHSAGTRQVRWWQHNRELSCMDAQPCIDVPWTSMQWGLVSFESFHQRLFGKRSASGRRHRPGSGGQVTNPKGRPQACPVGG